MSTEPDTFEHLLDQYLFRMCTKYGYCIPRSDRHRLVYVSQWYNEDEFVKCLMLAEGLEPEEQPKHYIQMVRDLKEMVECFNKSH